MLCVFVCSVSKCCQEPVLGYLSGSGSRGGVAVEMQRVGDKYFSNLKKDAYIMYVCYHQREK